MQTIGRYQIGGELGRGAMGIVYRATDPSIGRTVAIKTIRLQDLADLTERARLRDRLFREAQSAGILSHPNLVTIYDIAEEGDIAYIAMEFVDGPTLERLFHSGPLDRGQILDVLRQTAAALDYAHRRGIVHRDIKPSNIMLHENRVVKITDFGVARIQSQQLTQAGTLMGTPNYMSPEQVQGLTVDGRADQFSLAVIAYELLTGEKPFTGDSVPTLVFKIVHEQPLAPQRINPSLGWPVETVLRRALAKNPRDRYSSCEEFIQALENAVKSSKDWKPLPPGASQAMPTLMESATPRPAPAAIAESVHGADEEEKKPWLLQAVRTVALVLLGAALVGAAILGAMKFLSTRPAERVAEVRPETPPAQYPPPPEAPAVQPPPEAATPPRGEAAEPETPVAEPLPDAPRTSPRAVIPGQDAVVRLISSPPGALVTVDGSSAFSCTAPCSLTLPPGRHTLSAALAGYRRGLKIFESPRDSEMFVHLERATGTLAIRSQPSGASIIVNGQERAEKTPTAITLPVGHYRVEIVKEGYPKDVEEVEVKDSVLTNIDVNWPSPN